MATVARVGVRAASARATCVVVILFSLAALSGCVEAPQVTSSDQNPSKEGLQLDMPTYLCGDAASAGGQTFGPRLENVGHSNITVTKVRFGSATNLRLAQAALVPLFNSDGQMTAAEIDSYPPKFGDPDGWRSRVPVGSKSAVTTPGQIDRLLIAAVRKDLSRKGTATDIQVEYEVGGANRTLTTPTVKVIVLSQPCG